MKTAIAKPLTAAQIVKGKALPTRLPGANRQDGVMQYVWAVLGDDETSYVSYNIRC
jgi:hypothetical protein